MSNIRVFELAKELNQPAKQLLQRVRALGIPAENSFSELTEEQVKLVQQALSAKPEQEDTVVKKVRRRISKSLSEQETTESDDSKGKSPRRIRKGGKRISKDEETTENKEVTAAATDVETESDAPTPDAAKETAIQEPTQVEEVQSEAKEETPEAKKETSEPVAKKEATPAAEKEPEAKTTESKVEPSKVAAKADTSTEKAPAPKTPEVTPSLEPIEAKSDKKKEKKKDKKAPKAQEPSETEQRPAKKSNLRGLRSIDNSAFLKRQSHKNIKRVDSLDESKSWERDGAHGKGKFQEPKKEKHTFEPRKKSIKINDAITVSDLAGAIGIKVSEIIKKLMALGTMATINQSIPGETAVLIASEFNIDVEMETRSPEEILKQQLQDTAPSKMASRAPVVTIMGHVDHGKTSLLDKIRESRVAGGEAGGITQHIGAYHVDTAVGPITFLDTPGHEAFTAMRARGAHVTDIVVLVVAADDSVQPQTIEAIHHAQAANVPIVVAINKIDRPEAEPQRVQNDLLEHNLIPESLGGETLFVNVSAKKGDGIEQLLELIQLQAEVLELEANTEGFVQGVIIESQMLKGRGPVGTVLVQEGKLKVGDTYLVGEMFGRVRALLDEHGKQIKEATPVTPVEILGFDTPPSVGDTFLTVPDEKTARQVTEIRAQRNKEEKASQRKVRLEDLFDQAQDSEYTELRLLIKADVQGSAEALENSLLQLSKDNVSVKIIHSAAGNITESDVMLASASDAVILGFNTKPESKARNVARKEGVDIRSYSIIYDAIEDVRKSISGLLSPIIREEVIGHCEIRKLYKTSKGVILGCYVTDGKVSRNAKIRALHGDEVVNEGKLISLKRFKDDVKEVGNNYECGIGVDFDGLQEGDILEAYIEVQEAATV